MEKLPEKLGWWDSLENRWEKKYTTFWIFFRQETETTCTIKDFLDDVLMIPIVKHDDEITCVLSLFWSQFD